MHWSSPRDKRRLEDVRGVDRALGGAGADERVELVDEEDRVVDVPELLDDLLQALLELAAVLSCPRPGTRYRGSVVTAFSVGTVHGDAKSVVAVPRSVRAVEKFAQYDGRYSSAALYGSQTP